MKYLALERERETGSNKPYQIHLRAEAQRVWELYMSGIVREIYFRADQTTAVLILECPDAKTATAHLSSLPLVEAGLIEFDIISLIPYTGFARLFAAEPNWQT